MDYPSMTEDLVQFTRENGLGDICLIGHSMYTLLSSTRFLLTNRGGKVAMHTALSRALPVSKLIVVDMAPVQQDLGSTFRNYISAMERVEKARVSSTAEADKVLQQTIPV